MNATYSNFFDTVILDAATPAVMTKAAAKPRTDSAPAMPVSLWRHTQNEAAAGSRHRFVARGILAGIAALGLGSTAYALWQTGVLMSGSHFQTAIGAFLH